MRTDKLGSSINSIVHGVLANAVTYIAGLILAALGILLAHLTPVVRQFAPLSYFLVVLVVSILALWGANIVHDFRIKHRAPNAEGVPSSNPADAPNNDADLEAMKAEIQNLQAAFQKKIDAKRIGLLAVIQWPEFDKLTKELAR